MGEWVDPYEAIWARYDRIKELKNILLSDAQRALEKRGWKEKIMDKLMAMCMADDGLRTQLFRFIDVFPALKTNKDITEHFMSYVGPHRKAFPWIIEKVLWFVDKPICDLVAGSIISWSMRLFAKHFIIDSTDQKKIERVGQSLRGQGYDITWDILGEDILSKDEAEIFRKRYLDLIERLGSLGAPAGFTNNVSVKMSSLVPKLQWDAINFNGCANMVGELFAELLRAGKRNGVTITIDIEQYAVRDLTLYIFKNILEKPEFKDLKASIAFQTYLADAPAKLYSLLMWCYLYQRPITIRLVKGAYWDYEVINARQQGWPIPVLLKKEDADWQFKDMAETILHAQKYMRRPVTLACASHNLESIACVIQKMEELEIDKNKNEFQVLYGMGDPVREAILKAGYPVRVYTPYGELIPSMGYFVRRLLENTSQQSFLGLNFLQKPETKKEEKS